MMPARSARARRLNIVRERLANQFLTVAGPRSASEVVAELGAVQAQDYAGAKWALTQRSGFRSDAAIEKEIVEGRILRTHVLRPTWHFVAAADIGWLLQLTGPRVLAKMASYDKVLGLTPQIFRRCNNIIARALEGGRYLTRSEIGAVLRRNRVSNITPQRLGHIVMHAELNAIVCSGPRKGKQFTYALLDERASAHASHDFDELLLELTRRYFRTRSPATAYDFAWWSGLTVNEARRGITMFDDELEKITIDDKHYWLHPRAVAAPSERGSTFLLPNYDEYFIGFRDRSAIGERMRHVKLVTGGNALISNVVIVEGQIVGGWRRSVSDSEIAVDLTLPIRLTPQERKQIDAAVNGFRAYLGPE
jgi:hypothetical protein